MQIQIIIVFFISILPCLAACSQNPPDPVKEIRMQMHAIEAQSLWCGIVDLSNTNKRILIPFSKNAVNSGESGTFFYDPQGRLRKVQMRHCMMYGGDASDTITDYFDDKGRILMRLIAHFAGGDGNARGYTGYCYYIQGKKPVESAFHWIHEYRGEKFTIVHRYGIPEFVIWRQDGQTYFSQRDVCITIDDVYRKNLISKPTLQAIHGMTLRRPGVLAPGKKAFINAQDVNIRIKPSLTSTVIFSAGAGNLATILALAPTSDNKAPGWIRIRLENPLSRGGSDELRHRPIYGWIFRDFLTLERN